MGALDGVLVVDFSTLVPGPLATLFLAEAGAEVIKIERPGTGDEMRSYDPRIDDESANFLLLNRGKKSIALDLKNERDRALLMPLIEKADIVVEQFRPGVMDRLGLGYEKLSAVNSKLIYCSITGYGQSGSLRDTAGHDLNYIAKSGLLALSMGAPDAPVIPPALIADIAGGAYPAVMNILLALRLRDKSGVGCHLDIAMTENLFPFMYWALGAGAATGVWPGNGTDLVTGGTPRYRLYPTSDGRMVAAAPIEQKFWDAFCDIIGLEEQWRNDARDPDETARQVAAIIASRGAEEWDELFKARDCCCCLVRDLAEATANPHFLERGLFAPGAVPTLPVPIDRALRADIDGRAPALDQHHVLIAQAAD